MEEFGLGLEGADGAALQQQSGIEGGAAEQWQEEPAAEAAQQQHDEDPVEALRQQKRQYVDWFTQFIASQAGVALPPADTDTQPQQEQDVQQQRETLLLELQPYAPLPVPELVNSLYKATAAHSHLSALKYWAEMVRELERAQRDVRDAGPSLSPTLDAEAYTAAMHRSIQALGAAYYAADVAKYYGPASAAAAAAPSPAPAPALSQASAAIDARMQQCRCARPARAHRLEGGLRTGGLPAPLFTLLVMGGAPA